jgi:chromosome segregation ATPase
MNLYTRVTADGRTITVVIIEALELLAGKKEESINPDHAQKEERINDLLERIGDLQTYVDTLKNELEKASHDKEDLKTTHTNYMMQIQTLINQKAIEVPGAKKPWWRFW